VGPEYSYLKYYIAMQSFTLLTGKGILGGVDIILLLILYIFDTERNKPDVPDPNSAETKTVMT
jgi:hypothetical protein